MLLLLLIVPCLGLAEPEMVCDQTVCATGGVVDLHISGADNATCTYSVYADGELIFTGEPDTHLSASYRPRKPGAYTIQAALQFPDGTEKKLFVSFTVTGEETDSASVIYSQRDGWWKDKSYRDSDLDKSGCAIFTLSHALYRMGLMDESTFPAQLGKTYASCLITGGTSVVRLINQAAEDFGFQTRSDLIESKNEIKRQFQDGAMFSFAIVFGHIALATDLTSDGKKVEVVDSAPGVTFERIKGSMYIRDGSGKYEKITDPGQIPGIRYYFETAQFGGASYFLDFSYVAGRGVRLIKPYQVIWHEDGTDVPVELLKFGTMFCEVTKTGKKTHVVPTADIQWRARTQEKTAALITGTKAVPLKDAGGNKLKTVPGRTVLPVLEIGEKQLKVRYDTVTGYIDSKGTELIPLSFLQVKTGFLSLNGSVSGRAKIKVRQTPGGKLLDEYPTGTEIAIFGEKDDAYEIEAEGRRGFVQKDYVTFEEQEEQMD